MDYRTMTLDEIFDFKFSVAPDAWLFCWSTQRFLADALRVVEIWGFKYLLTMTWDKRNGMCLMGFHWRTEFCVVGHRGHVETFRHGLAVPTIIAAKSPRHSEKPDAFYRAIEHLGKKRIDIFARKRREGWDVWGDEIDEVHG